MPKYRLWLRRVTDEVAEVEVLAESPEDARLAAEERLIEATRAGRCWYDMQHELDWQDERNVEIFVTADEPEEVARC